MNIHSYSNSYINRLGLGGLYICTLGPTQPAVLGRCFCVHNAIEHNWQCCAYSVRVRAVRQQACSHHSVRVRVRAVSWSPGMQFLPAGHLILSRHPIKAAHWQYFHTQARAQLL